MRMRCRFFWAVVRHVPRSLTTSAERQRRYHFVATVRDVSFECLKVAFRPASGTVPCQGAAKFFRREERRCGRLQPPRAKITSCF